MGRQHGTSGLGKCRNEETNATAGNLQATSLNAEAEGNKVQSLSSICRQMPIYVRLAQTELAFQV